MSHSITRRTAELQGEVKEINIPKDLIPAKISLVGVPTNSGAILDTVARALQKEGNPIDILDSYRKQAMSADYLHLLRVSMEFCDAAYLSGEE